MPAFQSDAFQGNAFETGETGPETQAILFGLISQLAVPFGPVVQKAARVSQLVVEAAVFPDPNARLSQLVIEVALYNPPQTVTVGLISNPTSVFDPVIAQFDRIDQVVWIA